MNVELLESIGLTKAEIKVYFTLLELGSSTTGPIVEKSRVSSSKIYEILEKLMQKGLASFVIEAGMKYYEAAKPSRLLDYMKEKEETITKQRQELQHIIPELELKQKYSKLKSEATIFRGLKGVKTAYEDILNTLKPGDEYYVTGGMLPHKAYFTFIEEFHKRRSKKGIKVKILYTEFAKSIAHKISGLPGTKIKFASDKFLASCFVVMYQTKTLITVASKDDLTLFKIDNKGVTESFIAQFNALWEQKLSVFEGKETTNFFTNILRDLKEGEEYYVINGNYGDIPEFRDFFGEYHKKRSEKGIKANLLFNQNVKGKEQAFALSPAECKFLPPDFKSPLQMTFYKQKLYISLWQKKAIGVLIEDAGIVAAFKAYFTQLWQQKAQTMYGESGIRAACDAIIEENKDFYIIGANGMIMKKYAFLLNMLEKKREKTTIERYHLAIEKTRGMPINKLPRTHVRYLPEQFDSPNVIWVFGNKVAHILWESDVVILLDDARIADDYRNYFNLLWKNAKN